MTPAYRTHPVPTVNDFHMSLLWLRSLEIAMGSSPAGMMQELNMADLWSRYRSPWRA